MGKYFTYEERCELQGYIRAGLKQTAIADLLGKSTRTIRREIQRGQTKFFHYHAFYEYRAKTAQRRYEEVRKHKGCKHKILQDPELMHDIEEAILMKDYSPDITLGRMKLEGKNIKYPSAREHFTVRFIKAFLITFPIKTYGFKTFITKRKKWPLNPKNIPLKKTLKTVRFQF